MNRRELGQMFRKDEVKAFSLEDFMDRYYKPDRYRGRGLDYAAGLLASKRADLEQDGWTIISHHDSVTGKVVAYFSDQEPPAQQFSLFDGLNNC